MKLTRKQRLVLRKKRISRHRNKRRKINKLKDSIEIYRNDSVKFIEDFLGFKLASWQKALLRLDKPPILMALPRRHGYRNYIEIKESINKLIKKEL